MSGNKRRMNMLLASFYGMQQDTAQRQVDELDMDSAAFQPTAYVQKRLREDPLPELVALTKSLGNETKGLDSGVQNLVYENYSKFISATDTIRSMKTSVGEMETETQRLVEGMGGVAGTTQGVASRLEANRERVSKLVGVERLLSRLRFLFDLPSRLNRSIELDAHEQAVRYYTTAATVLRKHSTVPSLKAILIEADAIMSKLSAQLRERLHDYSTSSERMLEALRLLKRLDEPRQELCSSLVDWNGNVLTLSLNEIRSSMVVAGAPGAGGDEGAATCTPVEFMTTLSETFLDQYLQAVETYRSMFEQPDGGSGGRGAGSGAGAGAGEEALVADARAAMVTLTKRLFALYFSLVRDNLSKPPPQRPPPPAPSPPPSTPSGAADASAAGDGPSETAAGSTSAGAGAGASTGADGGASATSTSGAGAGAGAGAGSSAPRRRNPFDSPISSGKPRNPFADSDDEDEDEDEAEAAAPASSTGDAPGNPFGDSSTEDGATAPSAGGGGGASTVDGGAHSDAGGADDEDDVGDGTDPELEPYMDKFSTLVEALRVLMADVSSANALYREAQLGHRAAETMEAVLRKQVDAAFDAVRHDMVARIAGLLPRIVVAVSRQGQGDATSVPYRQLASRTSEDLTRLAERVLKECKPLVAAGMRLLPDMALPFAQLMCGRVQHLVLWLANALECHGQQDHPARAGLAERLVTGEAGGEYDAGGGSKSPQRRRVSVNAPALPVTPEFVLTLACVARDFMTRGVPAVLDTLTSALSADSLLDPEDVAIARACEPELIARTQGAGRQLLSRFVMMQGDRLGSMLQKSIDTPDWHRMREPREARMVVTLVLEEILRLKGQVSAAIGDGGGAGGGFGTGGGLDSPSDARLDRDRRFAKRLRVYGQVVFSTDSVVAYVLRLMYKTLYECIRLRTFGRNGYQQLQVDVAVFQLALPSLVLSPEVLDELLNEAIASASERCLAPNDLESSVVFDIAQRQLEALGLL